MNISMEYFYWIFQLYISEEYFSGIFGKCIEKKYYNHLVSIISVEYLPYDLPDEFCHFVAMTSVKLCENINLTHIHL